MTGEDFLKQKRKPKVMVNGAFGTGKTYFGMSAPKVYYLETEPGGLQILHAPDAVHLRSNLVEYEQCYLDPLDGKDSIKRLVEEVHAPVSCPRKDVKAGLIYEALDRANKAYREGKVETLFLDNLTYLSQMFFEYCDQFLRPEFVTQGGNIETRQMYGYVSRWLFRFLMGVVCFPGNVVVSCHLKDESDEKLKKKKDSSVTIVPNILGGFRDKAEGLFTASIYLERKLVSITESSGKTRHSPKFIAYTQNCHALGSKILAKNRHGLPPVMENITFEKIVTN